MESLNISLPETLTAYVHERMATDGYDNASEYIRELIRADQKERALREMEAEILQGLKSGPAEPVTAEMWATLRESVSRVTDAKLP